MGRFCEATSSLVYGVQIESPELGICWPFLLKRLKEIAGKDTHDPAAKEEEATSEELQTKVAKIEKQSFLLSTEEVNEMLGEEDGSYDGIDPIAECNFLSYHKKELEETVVAALDTVLGVGHNLTLKVYFGHTEDDANFLMMLHSKENTSQFTSSVSWHDGVGACQVDFTLSNKEKTNTLIQKALDAFGLTVDTENSSSSDPTWTMVTECKYYS
jgi:hypothetical protein